MSKVRFELQDKKETRFELLLTQRERQALQRIAENQGVSMGSVLRNEIRRVAKRKKLWQ